MMERSLRQAPNKHITVNYLRTELILLGLVELVKIALYYKGLKLPHLCAVGRHPAEINPINRFPSESVFVQPGHCNRDLPLKLS